MKKSIFFLVLIFHLFSCGKNGTVKIVNSDTDTIALPQQNLDEIITQNNVYTNYKLPLPTDIVNFVKNSNYFFKDILNPIENADKYTKEIVKALNLGVYTADLAYCTFLEEGQTSLDYYQLCYEISKSLEINDGYTEKYFERLNKNIGNTDSLIALANESYNRTCNYLEKQGRNNILPFVIIGGWYESLSLVILFGKKGKVSAKKVRDFILQQQKGVENLINYLYDVQIETSAFAYHEELSKFIEHLKKIKAIYQDYRNSQDTNLYKVLIEEILRMRSMIIRNAIR